MRGSTGGRGMRFVAGEPGGAVRVRGARMAAVVDFRGRDFGFELPVGVCFAFVMALSNHKRRHL